MQVAAEAAAKEAAEAEERKARLRAWDEEEVRGWEVRRGVAVPFLAVALGCRAQAQAQAE